MREKLKSLDRNIVAFIIIIVLLIVGAAFANSTNNTDEGDTSSAPVAEVQEDQEAESEKEHDNEATKQEEAASDESNGQYTYIAQPGDSYTKIVRKAVQTYGIVNNVTLSPAQIVFAETALTQAANAPLLEVGQELHFTEETLKSTIESAVGLGEEAEANWEYYVQFVDFDTNNVGETRE